MRNSIRVSLVVALLVAAPAYAGISDNDKINAGDALLIGGTQPAWIDIDGQNRGDTEIVLSIDDGETIKTVAAIAPGEKFIQSVPKNRTLVIGNSSENETARVYWHISGYSKQANPRFASAAQE